jgi:hypothetical protein
LRDSEDNEGEDGYSEQQPQRDTIKPLVGHHRLISS